MKARWPLPLSVVLGFALVAAALMRPRTSTVDAVPRGQIAALEARMAELEAKLKTTNRRRLLPAPAPSVAPVPIATEPAAPAAPAVEPAPIAVPPDRAVVQTPAAPQRGAEDPWLPPRRDSPVFDIDQNGEVTPDEKARADELAARTSKFAANRSTDGTYPILADDFRGHGKLFAAMDEDGDGALSEREAVRYFVDSIRQLRRYDQNADGALVLAEFGHLESRFGFLDTNQDQRIEAWEINLLRARGRW